MTQYNMRGYRLTAPVGYWYWSVLNTPDTTGAQSGVPSYQTALINIVVNSITGSSGINGVPYSQTSPVNSAVAVYNSTASQYDIRPLNSDDLVAGFSISSFSGGSTVEIGATVTNPSFTASYSSTPSSANITNTDSLDSPHTLTTPYTSATITGAFHHTAQASVTFTLTAVGTSTKTATQNINFFPRMFAGVGGAGAASATASGTTAVLNASLGTLTSIGLLSSLAVNTLISFSPSAQKLYVLATGSGHTFVDNSNNLPFPFNTATAVSFTNVNGSVVSMFLYESTNTLTGSFTLKVTA